jgi:shikimate kinase
MEWMNDEGVTIYLRRTAEQIHKRLSDYGRQKRPMFRGKSDEELLEFMTQQMAARERSYAKAQYIIDCSVMSDDDIVNYITQLITRL